ncbi:MAG: EAL domain-containing protein [Acidimicrobiia bacterium]|nr:EAL domain-containing protein [Acidimicrobiia bacterium]
MTLISLIGFLVWTDAQSLLELRQFRVVTEEVSALVETRASIQAERHQLVDGDPTTPASAETDTPAIVVESFDSGALDALQDLNAASNVGQDLLTARSLAANRQSAQAAVIYTELIDAFGATIEAELASAPLGRAEQRRSALLALLDAEELLLLEDLEARLGDADPTVLTRLHTSASGSLGRFTINATEDGAAALEALTISPAWRTITLIRSEYLDLPTNGLEEDRWKLAADVRRLSLAELVTDETTTLRTSIASAADKELGRLLLLTSIVLTVLALAIFGAVALRRSIVGPLSTLRANARKLSKGELAPLADPASDEIAEVAGAFSTLATTMEKIWKDVDDVSASISSGVYTERIDTSELEGDWLRLANTMNATLATSEDHRDTVREELDRREVMTEISNAAVLAETAPELTSAVLHHLPRALHGSHAHLHEHPSGPPLIDLGVALEPSISALQVPTLTDQAQLVELRNGHGVASLVAFPVGPPAVLVLVFGDVEPAHPEPLVSLIETAGRILAQAHRRQHAESSATHSREHDLLTGLPNSTHLQRWFREQDATAVGWTAIGIHPQRLEELDGSFGRDARDLVLRRVAKHIESIVQTTLDDRRATGSIARIGQPDFVVLVPETQSSQLVDAIVDGFAEPLDVDGTSISVAMTIGLDQVDHNDRDLTQTLANLSAAIRQSDSRTTQVVHFESRHRDEVRRRTQLIAWLEQAIGNRDLSIHFQPVVNAVTTAIEGYECLIRGELDGKPVSPAEFVPLAEETNLIMAIGEFALREACAALPFLPGQSPYVAVNLSPVELGDPHLLDRIDSVLNQSAVDRSRVVFEITEGVATSQADVDLLHRLRRMGVKIAIDDFGSGQSNLSYLNSLPAQILKLDRSLITPIVDDVGAAGVVRRAIEMAHDLGMTVVGEGVETNEELNALRRLRCDLIQGWLTGRPAPLDSFIEITIDRPVTQIDMPNESR